MGGKRGKELHISPSCPQVTTRQFPARLIMEEITLVHGGLLADGQALFTALVNPSSSADVTIHEIHHVSSTSKFEAEDWSGEHELRVPEPDDEAQRRRSIHQFEEHAQIDSAATAEEQPVASSAQFDRTRSDSLSAALLEKDPQGQPSVQFTHIPPTAPILEAEPHDEEPFEVIEAQQQGAAAHQSSSSPEVVDSIPTPDREREKRPSPDDLSAHAGALEAEPVLTHLLFTLKGLKMSAPEKHKAAVERLRQLEQELREAGAVCPPDPAVADAVSRALASAAPGHDIQIRVNQSRHTTTTKTVYETETPGMVGLDAEHIRNLQQQMLNTLTSGAQDSTAESGTTQKKESAEEGFTNDDGSVVVSKKMTRIVTTTRTTLPGEGDSAGSESPKEQSPTESLGSVKDRIAIFESIASKKVQEEVTSEDQDQRPEEPVLPVPTLIEEVSREGETSSLPVDIIVTPVTPTPRGEESDEEIRRQEEIHTDDEHPEVSEERKEPESPEERAPKRHFDEFDGRGEGSSSEGDDEDQDKPGRKIRRTVESVTRTSYHVKKEGREREDAGAEGFEVEERPFDFIRESAVGGTHEEEPIERTTTTTVTTEYMAEKEQEPTEDTEVSEYETEEDEESGEFRRVRKVRRTVEKITKTSYHIKKEGQEGEEESPAETAETAPYSEEVSKLRGIQHEEEPFSHPAVSSVYETVTEQPEEVSEYETEEDEQTGEVRRVRKVRRTVDTITKTTYHIKKDGVTGEEVEVEPTHRDKASPCQGSEAGQELGHAEGQLSSVPDTVEEPEVAEVSEYETEEDEETGEVRRVRKIKRSVDTITKTTYHIKKEDIQGEEEEPGHTVEVSPSAEYAKEDQEFSDAAEPSTVGEPLEISEYETEEDEETGEVRRVRKVRRTVEKITKTSYHIKKEGQEGEESVVEDESAGKLAYYEEISKPHETHPDEEPFYQTTETTVTSEMREEPEEPKEVSEYETEEDEETGEVRRVRKIRRTVDTITKTSYHIRKEGDQGEESEPEYEHAEAEKLASQAPPETRNVESQLAPIPTIRTTAPHPEYLSEDREDREEPVTETYISGEEQFELGESGQPSVRSGIETVTTTTYMVKTDEEGQYSPDTLTDDVVTEQEAYSHTEDGSVTSPIGDHDSQGRTLDGTKDEISDEEYGTMRQTTETAEYHVEPVPEEDLPRREEGETESEYEAEGEERGHKVLKHTTEVVTTTTLHFQPEKDEYREPTSAVETDTTKVAELRSSPSDEIITTGKYEDATRKTFPEETNIEMTSSIYEPTGEPTYDESKIAELRTSPTEKENLAMTTSIYEPSEGIAPYESQRAEWRSDEEFPKDMTTSIYMPSDETQIDESKLADIRRSPSSEYQDQVMTESLYAASSEPEVEESKEAEIRMTSSEEDMTKELSTTTLEHKEEKSGEKEHQPYELQDHTTEDLTGGSLAEHDGDENTDEMLTSVYRKSEGGERESYDYSEESDHRRSPSMKDKSIDLAKKAGLIAGGIAAAPFALAAYGAATAVSALRTDATGEYAKHPDEEHVMSETASKEDTITTETTTHEEPTEEYPYDRHSPLAESQKERQEAPEPSEGQREKAEHAGEEYVPSDTAYAETVIATETTKNEEPIGEYLDDRRSSLAETQKERQETPEPSGEHREKAYLVDDKHVQSEPTYTETVITTETTTYEEPLEEYPYDRNSPVSETQKETQEEMDLSDEHRAKEEDVAEHVPDVPAQPAYTETVMTTTYEEPIEDFMYDRDSFVAEMQKEGLEAPEPSEDHSEKADVMDREHVPSETAYTETVITTDTTTYEEPTEEFPYDRHSPVAVSQKERQGALEDSEENREKAEYLDEEHVQSEPTYTETVKTTETTKYEEPIEEYPYDRHSPVAETGKEVQEESGLSEEHREKAEHADEEYVPSETAYTETVISPETTTYEEPTEDYPYDRHTPVAETQKKMQEESEERDISEEHREKAEYREEEHGPSEPAYTETVIATEKTTYGEPIEEYPYESPSPVAGTRQSQEERDLSEEHRETAEYPDQERIPSEQAYTETAMTTDTTKYEELIEEYPYERHSPVAETQKEIQEEPDLSEEHRGKAAHPDEEHVPAESAHADTVITTEATTYQEHIEEFPQDRHSPVAEAQQDIYEEADLLEENIKKVENPDEGHVPAEPACTESVMTREKSDLSEKHQEKMEHRDDEQALSVPAYTETVITTEITTHEEPIEEYPYDRHSPDAATEKEMQQESSLSEQHRDKAEHPHEKHAPSEPAYTEIVKTTEIITYGEPVEEYSYDRHEDESYDHSEESRHRGSPSMKDKSVDFAKKAGLIAGGIAAAPFALAAYGAATAVSALRGDATCEHAEHQEEPFPSEPAYTETMMTTDTTTYEEPIEEYLYDRHSPVADTVKEMQEEADLSEDHREKEEHPNEEQVPSEPAYSETVITMETTTYEEPIEEYPYNRHSPVDEAEKKLQKESYLSDEHREKAEHLNEEQVPSEPAYSETVITTKTTTYDEPIEEYPDDRLHPVTEEEKEIQEEADLSEEHREKAEHPDEEHVLSEPAYTETVITTETTTYEEPVEEYPCDRHSPVADTVQEIREEADVSEEHREKAEHSHEEHAPSESAVKETEITTEKITYEDHVEEFPYDRHSPVAEAEKQAQEESDLSEELRGKVEHPDEEHVLSEPAYTETVITTETTTYEEPVEEYPCDRHSPVADTVQEIREEADVSEEHREKAEHSHEEHAPSESAVKETEITTEKITYEVPVEKFPYDRHSPVAEAEKQAQEESDLSEELREKVEHPDEEHVLSEPAYTETVITTETTTYEEPVEEYPCDRHSPVADTVQEIREEADVSEEHREKAEHSHEEHAPSETAFKETEMTTDKITYEEPVEEYPYDRHSPVAEAEKKVQVESDLSEELREKAEHPHEEHVLSEPAYSETMITTETTTYEEPIEGHPYDRHSPVAEDEKEIQEEAYLSEDHQEKEEHPDEEHVPSEPVYAETMVTTETTTYGDPIEEYSYDRRSPVVEAKTETTEEADLSEEHREKTEYTDEDHIPSEPAYTETEMTIEKITYEEPVEEYSYNRHEYVSSDHSEGSGHLGSPSMKDKSIDLAKKAGMIAGGIAAAPFALAAYGAATAVSALRGDATGEQAEHQEEHVPYEPAYRETVITTETTTYEEPIEEYRYDRHSPVAETEKNLQEEPDKSEDNREKVEYRDEEHVPPEPVYAETVITTETTTYGEPIEEYSYDRRSPVVEAEKETQEEADLSKEHREKAEHPDEEHIPSEPAYTETVITTETTTHGEPIEGNRYDRHSPVAQTEKEMQGEPDHSEEHREKKEHPDEEHVPSEPAYAETVITTETTTYGEPIEEYSYDRRSPVVETEKEAQEEADLSEEHREKAERPDEEHIPSEPAYTETVITTETTTYGESIEGDRYDHHSPVAQTKKDMQEEPDHSEEHREKEEHPDEEHIPSEPAYTETVITTETTTYEEPIEEYPYDRHSPVAEAEKEIQEEPDLSEVHREKAEPAYTETSKTTETITNEEPVEEYSYDRHEDESYDNSEETGHSGSPSMKDKSTDLAKKAGLIAGGIAAAPFALAAYGAATALSALRGDTTDELAEHQEEPYPSVPVYTETVLTTETTTYEEPTEEYLYDHHSPVAATRNERHDATEPSKEQREKADHAEVEYIPSSQTETVMNTERAPYEEPIEEYSYDRRSPVAVIEKRIQEEPDLPEEHREKAEHPDEEHVPSEPAYTETVITTETTTHEEPIEVYPFDRHSPVAETEKETQEEHNLSEEHRNNREHPDEEHIPSEPAYTETVITTETTTHEEPIEEYPFDRHSPVAETDKEIEEEHNLSEEHRKKGQHPDEEHIPSEPAYTETVITTETTTHEEPIEEYPFDRHSPVAETEIEIQEEHNLSEEHRKKGQHPDEEHIPSEPAYTETVTTTETTTHEEPIEEHRYDSHSPVAETEKAMQEEPDHLEDHRDKKEHPYEKHVPSEPAYTETVITTETTAYEEPIVEYHYDRHSPVAEIEKEMQEEPDHSEDHRDKKEHRDEEHVPSEPAYTETVITTETTTYGEPIEEYPYDGDHPSAISQEEVEKSSERRERLEAAHISSHDETVTGHDRESVISTQEEKEIPVTMYEETEQSGDLTTHPSDVDSLAATMASETVKSVVSVETMAERVPQRQQADDTYVSSEYHAEEDNLPHDSRETDPLEKDSFGQKLFGFAKKAGMIAGGAVAAPVALAAMGAKEAYKAVKKRDSHDGRYQPVATEDYDTEEELPTESDQLMESAHLEESIDDRELPPEEAGFVVESTKAAQNYSDITFHEEQLPVEAPIREQPSHVIDSSEYEAPCHDKPVSPVDRELLHDKAGFVDEYSEAWKDEGAVSFQEEQLPTESNAELQPSYVIDSAEYETPDHDRPVSPVDQELLHDKAGFVEEYSKALKDEGAVSFQEEQLPTESPSELQPSHVIDSTEYETPDHDMPISPVDRELLRQDVEIVVENAEAAEDVGSVSSHEEKLPTESRTDEQPSHVIDSTEYETPDHDKPISPVDRELLHEDAGFVVENAEAAEDVGFVSFQEEKLPTESPTDEQPSHVMDSTEYETPDHDRPISPVDRELLHEDAGFAVECAEALKDAGAVSFQEEQLPTVSPTEQQPSHVIDSTEYETPDHDRPVSPVDRELLREEVEFVVENAEAAEDVGSVSFQEEKLPTESPTDEQPSHVIDSTEYETPDHDMPISPVDRELLHEDAGFAVECAEALKDAGAVSFQEEQLPTVSPTEQQPSHVIDSTEYETPDHDRPVSPVDRELLREEVEFIVENAEAAEDVGSGSFQEEKLPTESPTDEQPPHVIDSTEYETPDHDMPISPVDRELLHEDAGFAVECAEALRDAGAVSFQEEQLPTVSPTEQQPSHVIDSTEYETPDHDRPVSPVDRELLREEVEFVVENAEAAEDVGSVSFQEEKLPTESPTDEQLSHVIDSTEYETPDHGRPISPVDRELLHEDAGFAVECAEALKDAGAVSFQEEQLPTASQTEQQPSLVIDSTEYEMPDHERPVSPVDREPLHEAAGFAVESTEALKDAGDVSFPEEQLPTQSSTEDQPSHVIDFTEYEAPYHDRPVSPVDRDLLHEEAVFVVESTEALKDVSAVSLKEEQLPTESSTEEQPSHVIDSTEYETPDHDMPISPVDRELLHEDAGFAVECAEALRDAGAVSFQEEQLPTVSPTEQQPSHVIDSTEYETSGHDRPVSPVDRELLREEVEFVDENAEAAEDVGSVSFREEKLPTESPTDEQPSHVIDSTEYETPDHDGPISAVDRELLHEDAGFVVENAEAAEDVGSVSFQEEKLPTESPTDEQPSHVIDSTEYETPHHDRSVSPVGRELLHEDAGFVVDSSEALKDANAVFFHEEQLRTVSPTVEQPSHMVDSTAYEAPHTDRREDEVSEFPVQKTEAIDAGNFPDHDEFQLEAPGGVSAPQSMTSDERAPISPQFDEQSFSVVTKEDIERADFEETKDVKTTSENISEADDFEFVGSAEESADATASGAEDGWSEKFKDGAKTAGLAAGAVLAAPFAAAAFGVKGAIDSVKKQMAESSDSQKEHPEESSDQLNVSSTTQSPYKLSSVQDETIQIADESDWKVYNSKGEIVEEFSAQLVEDAVVDATEDTALRPSIPSPRQLLKQESCNEIAIEPEVDYQSDLQEKLDILAAQSQTELPMLKEEEDGDDHDHILIERDEEELQTPVHEDVIQNSASRLVDDVLSAIVEDSQTNAESQSLPYHTATTQSRDYETAVTSQSTSFQSAQQWTSQDSEYTTAPSDATSVVDIRDEQRGLMTPTAMVSPLEEEKTLSTEEPSIIPTIRSFEVVFDESKSSTPDVLLRMEGDDESPESESGGHMQSSPSGVLLAPDIDPGRPVSPIPPTRTDSGIFVGTKQPEDTITVEQCLTPDILEFTADSKVNPLLKKALDQSIHEKAMELEKTEMSYSRQMSDLSSESAAETVIHAGAREVEELIESQITAVSTDSLDKVSMKSGGSGKRYSTSRRSSSSASGSGKTPERETVDYEKFGKTESSEGEDAASEQTTVIHTETEVAQTFETTFEETPILDQAEHQAQTFETYSTEETHAEATEAEPLETLHEEPEDNDSLNGSGSSSAGPPAALIGKYKHVSSDNISESSLQEFERIEQAVLNRGESSLTSSELELYVAGSRLRGSAEGSTNSLSEFEKLEQELSGNGTGATAAGGSPKDEDVMMLSDIREESEAEDMSVRDDEEDDNNSVSDVKIVPVTEDEERIATPTQLSPADSIERGMEIITSTNLLEQSTDSLEPTTGIELMSSSPRRDSLEESSLTEYEVVAKMHESLRDSLENLPHDRDSLLEGGTSQEMTMSQDTQGILSGDTVGTYQEHDEDEDSLTGDVDTMLSSYPTTLTTFETTKMNDDGTVETISRRVETRVHDPVVSHVTFTGTENEERLRQLPLEEQFETVDAEGNVTRTIVHRQTPTHQH